MESRKKLGLSAIVCLIITEFGLYSLFTGLDPYYYFEELRTLLVAIVCCLAAGVLIWFATFYKVRDRQLRAERAKLEDMVKIKALHDELGIPYKSDKGES